MIIIGVDFHPEFQQIASVDTDAGDISTIDQLAALASG